MTDQELTALIDHYVYGPDTSLVPQSLEVRKHSWREVHQARFDELGLPRTLGPAA